MTEQGWPEDQPGATPQPGQPDDEPGQPGQPPHYNSGEAYPPPPPPGSYPPPGPGYPSPPGSYPPPGVGYPPQPPPPGSYPGHGAGYFPPGGQPGYPGWGAPAPQTDSGAVIALVLAIAAFLICPVIPAIAALIVARNADRDIRNSGGAKTGEGLAKAARILAWVHLALAALAVIGIVLALIAAGVSTGGSTSVDTEFGSSVAAALLSTVSG